MGHNQHMAEEDILFETDQTEDVLASLRLLSLCLERVNVEPYLWKWIVVAAHNVLQGMCVAYLTHTDGGGAFARDGDKRYRDWLDRFLHGPDGEDEEIKDVRDKIFLDALPSLLDRIDIGRKVALPRKDAVEYGTDEGGWLRRLINFRNNFAHYPPRQTWIISKIDLKKCIEVAIMLCMEIYRRDDWPARNRFSETDFEQLCQHVLEALGRLQHTNDRLT